MPSSANIAIYQGDDYAAVVTVTDGSDTPPALTGYTAQAQIRVQPADGDCRVVVEMATSFTLPNLINLSIPRDQTVQMSGQYVWSLQLTDPSGAVQTILVGTVLVTRSVTRGCINGSNASVLSAAQRSATVLRNPKARDGGWRRESVTLAH